MLTRALSLLLALAPAALAQAESPAKVLFLGNSYTNANDLPGLVAGLAGAAGHSLTTTKNTPGGCTLGSPQGGYEHIANATSQAALAAGGWDVVVLQEQSVTPAIPHLRDTYMVPAAATLAGQVAAASPGAELLLFQTWGRRDPGTWCWSSWCQTYAGFDAMQDEVTAAYDLAAASAGAVLPTDVAPAGEAWRLFLQQHPGQPLHAPDGSHPNHAGSYLAACTIFARLYDQSPVGNGFHGSLTAVQAATLQQVAAEAVFGPTCGFASYGAGAGGANLLTLVASGDPGPGGSVQLDASGVTAPVWILATALAPTDLPLLGGTLLVDLTQPLLPLLVTAVGAPRMVTLPTDPAFTGLALHLQAAALDATQPAGWALSQGLTVTPCP